MIMNTKWQKSLVIRCFPGNNNREQKTIAYAGGKTGGHIVPCITLAAEEKKKNIHNKNIFFSTNASLDATIVKNNSNVIDIHKEMSLTQVPRNLYEIGSFMWHLSSSFCMAFYTLYTTKPDYIISTGGIVALPVCLAGYFLNIPIHLYELNATPGNAILKLASFADTVHCCFHGLDKYFPATKVVHADYPIRYQKEEIDKDQVQARLALGLDPHKPTITILGGSQGSQCINNIIECMIAADVDGWKEVQFIHQTGHNQVAEVKNFYQKQNIKAYVFDYSPNLSNMYAAANIIVGRAGAGTIFETAAFKKPCILVPLETDVNNHQLINARSIVEQDSAFFSFFRQNDLLKNPLLLADSIQSILKRGS